MVLEFKSEEKLTSDMVASWSAGLKIKPSLRSGSAVLGFFQSVATQLAYNQMLIEAINAFARASTAVGADLDLWMADFGFLRLASEKATGTVTLTLLSAQESAILVPVGLQFSTLDGSQFFEIIADTNKSAWSTEQQSYLIPSSVLSIDVTVRALLPGALGNVQPGKINQIVTGSESIDRVTNAQILSGGREAETDEEFRKRFVLWINSRSKATRDAILEAALGVKAGLNVKLAENVDQNGNARPGFFTVVIDDGSGDPPSGLIELVRAAIAEVVGFTIQFVVVGPTPIDSNVSMVINFKVDAIENEVLAAVIKALYDYVNALPIGETLYLSQLVAVAQGVTGVLSVEPNSTVIDDEEADLVAAEYEVIRLPLENLTVTAA